MRRWCELSGEVEITEGRFREAQLLTLSESPFEAEAEFIAELARRSMDRYESQPAPDLLVLEEDPLDRPDRTRSFYRRLFDEQGCYTDDFVTWASEELGLWLEESFERPLIAEANPMHGNEPVYDVFSVVRDDGGSPRLQLVQVKATEGQLGRNCNLALDKFRRHEVGGDYRAEILARLRLLWDSGRLPAGLQLRELLYDPHKRYRVTVVHGEDRAGLRIMTTYGDKVPGDIARRSARLIHFADWSAFWGTLARAVYAQLT